jgi:hypothetical protein
LVPWGIGGVPLRLNVCRVVVQDVEDEVGLVLVSTDDTGIAGHVVGNQGISAHSFLQAEVLAAMAGVDGVDLSFDALAVAAGVLHAVDVVLVEHR